MTYALKITTDLSVADAEAKVRQSLADEGFSIITEIDMAATMKAKLDLEIPPYKILGVCRAPLAAQALAADSDIGLLLPCNVVVYQLGGRTVIAALDPRAMLSLADAVGVDPVAEDAHGRLERALAAVASV